MTHPDPSSLTEWKERNRAQIAQRIAFLQTLPDGTIHTRPGSMHRLMIRKIGTRLELVFLGGKSTEVISDFDYADPLNLYAGFTQAMTLGLLWKSDPRRVYVLGFGAGRVPMILHHHYPDVVIESTDIDKDVVAVASEFCGIVPDERQRVFIEDGRQYLEDRDTSVKYDIIMVDAFRGVGFSPPLLSTREFLSTCRDHLTADGVLVVNLMMGDYLLAAKIKTLADSFKHVCSVLVPRDGTCVLFASNREPIPKAELVARAKFLNLRHQFTFPFVEHAERIVYLADDTNFARAASRAEILTDALAKTLSPLIAPAMPESADRLNILPPVSSTAAKVGRNELCPCGSGKKYKRCCGR